MKYTHTDLCQLENHSCFGCCGHHFSSRRSVKEDILKNTLSLFQFQEENKSLKEFRDRSQHVRKSGICYNLIFSEYKKKPKSKKTLCPLHPAQTGKDLRINHCDINHLCLTSYKYNKWSDSKKQRYQKFISAKKLDWYNYSLKTDNGELLREFEKKDGGKGKKN